jgi:hypothetical protein
MGMNFTRTALSRGGYVLIGDFGGSVFFISGVSHIERANKNRIATKEYFIRIGV